MPTPILLALYCTAIVLASLAGGALPLFTKLNHRRLQLILSAVSGFMLGVALLHLIPHASDSIGPKAACVCVLIGLLAMFLIERFFAFHHHEPPAPAPGSEAASSDHGHDHKPASASGGRGGGCGHDHEHDHSPLSWTGAAVGMTLHSLLGGVALGSAIAAEGGATKLAGLSVFVVILLHKPLDALTVMALVRNSKLADKTGHIINALFALAVPLGAALTVVGLDQMMSDETKWVGYALAFSAGTFLCISLSDLLPELHFHDHDRVPLTACLLLGIGLAFAVETIEHKVAHGDHDHGNHDHSEHKVEPATDPHAGHDDHSGHDHAGHNH